MSLRVAGNAEPPLHSESPLERSEMGHYVPKRQWRRKYLAFLRSAAWKVLRGAALESAGHRCTWCQRTEVLLHVHHLTYARFGGGELPTDLQVLCDGCHAEAHGKPYLLCKTTKVERKERRALVKVNRPETSLERAKARKKANARTKRRKWKEKFLETHLPDGSVIETPSLKDRC